VVVCRRRGDFHAEKETRDPEGPNEEMVGGEGYGEGGRASATTGINYQSSAERPPEQPGGTIYQHKGEEGSILSLVLQSSDWVAHARRRSVSFVLFAWRRNAKVPHHKNAYSHGF
jgi:hypothetical protein